MKGNISPGCDKLPRVSWGSVVGVGNRGCVTVKLALFAIPFAVGMHSVASHGSLGDAE